MYEFLGVLYKTGSGGYFWPREDMTNPLPLEFAFWIIVLLLTAALLLRPRAFAGCERRLTQLARRRWLSVLLVGLAALTFRLALLPLSPIPEPAVHDEFSFLMQGDTFVSGRLTNLPHPMWVHFETFHVNMLPTYQSMYPPAQAIFLAGAQWITGTPWLGVLLSVAVMCAAITWMLQGWMPPPWPLLGGVFCVLRFAIFSYWVNSFYGGAVAAFAGALVLGAAGRLRHKLSVNSALVLAIGLLLLANSRPYEGLVFSIPVLLALLLWTRHRPWAAFLRQLLLPAGLVLMIGAGGMLYYNWRGTGHPLLMPYKLNQQQYHITNAFLWQRRNPIPAYNHEVMRKFYMYWELPDYMRLHRNLGDGLRFALDKKFVAYYSFFVWPLALLLIPVCWQLLRSPKYRIFPAILLTVLAGLLLIMWSPQAQYPAPAQGALVALVLLGLRLLRTWRPRRLRLGLAASRAIVFSLLCWLVIVSGREVVNPYHLDLEYPHLPHQVDRGRLQASLDRLPGPQLILVKSRRTHQAGEDWVYNGANVDAAKVVWARDMGPEKNDELLRYYHNRHAWFVDQDDGIRRLTDYYSNPELAVSSLPLKLLHLPEPWESASTSPAATENADATRK